MDDEADWFGPDAATFGDRVAGAREATGMTQVQMARRLGVKKATVAAWENDLSEPRANNLSMMAGMLNVSIIWLITGEGEGTDAPHLIGDGQADFLPLLAEIRAIRGEMRTSAERLARVEKTLRQKLEQSS